MRVNIYAEEMTDRIEIIAKEIDGRQFTGLRFYLELPCTVNQVNGQPMNVSGPFIHRPGDDDSAAVTFWGKRDLRVVLRKALEMLDKHYEPATAPPSEPSREVGEHEDGIPDAPCPSCGYNGPGYYQPETHPCVRSPEEPEPCGCRCASRVSALEKWVEDFERYKAQKGIR